MIGTRKTLSLCTMTRGPSDRLVRLLATWRPLVDEIVMAVDADGDRDTIDACAHLADQRFFFRRDPRWPPEAPLGWLYAQCNGEWHFRVDDDESPSCALLTALPELLADPHVRTITLARRWLYPDVGRYIVDPPWHPDPQERLVRRRTYAIRGRMHTSIETMGPRLTRPDLALYHADCVVQPLSWREEKAARYERLKPGHSKDGVPVNAMYLPEEAKALRTEAVERDDRALLRHIFFGEAGTSPPDMGRRPGGPAPIHEAGTEELASHLPSALKIKAFQARRGMAKAARLVRRR